MYRAHVRIVVRFAYSGGDCDSDVLRRKSGELSGIREVRGALGKLNFRSDAYRWILGLRLVAVWRFGLTMVRDRAALHKEESALFGTVLRRAAPVVDAGD